MNWIFSSRIKFVGLEVILEVMTVVGGSGLFLTFWRSLGGPPGEQDVFKNTFLIKIVGKNYKNGVSLSNNAISNPLERKKLDIASFRKVLKTTHFDAFFVSPNWVFWNDGFR